MLGISGRALSKVTSSFMVITSDGVKNNIGLNLKFEAKGLKVIDYSRKDGRHWEFSEKAIELIRDYKVFPSASIEFPPCSSNSRPSFRPYSNTSTEMATVRSHYAYLFILLTPDLAMLRASDAFLDSDPDSQVREIKGWLKTRGVRDFEPVTLFSDQLTKACLWFYFTDARR